MPQITLKLSNNIDISKINYQPFFDVLHTTLGGIPGTHVASCHSGVIQEVYSHIGEGDKKSTKVYLEIYWLENAERALLKPALAGKLMTLLEETIVPQIENQGLTCVPRLRIANLGGFNQDYYISQRRSHT